MIGGLRKLHSDELHDIFSSSNIIRKMKYSENIIRWDGHVACIEANSSANNIFVRKPDGKGPLR